MELGTFGAVLKFAMDLEGMANTFYERAREIVGESSLASKFDTLRQRGEQRLKILERVRRENTTEMILEPIVGLDSEIYNLDIAIPSDSDESRTLDLAIQLENILYQFYSEAALKVEFLIEAAYSLEALADENEKAAESLSSPQA
ncbi:MAG: hypothetical protein EAX95_01645 [Candidatus Thorarchaeota archaeon]|nr:hypothetical protein [Candidatus Thorarchaeota archaeon]